MKNAFVRIRKENIAIPMRLKERGFAEIASSLLPKDCAPDIRATVASME
jgi:hypothetical protein